MHHIIVLLFIISGSANVLLSKYFNLQKFECNDGKLRNFYHPVLFTLWVSVGEFLCFAIYKIVYHILRYRSNGLENVNLITAGERTFSTSKLLISSICHVIGTLMLFIGLYLDYASSFLIIRNCTLIFVGIFSTMCLNTTLTLRHWLAMITISCGVLIVIGFDLNRLYDDANSLPYDNFNSVLTGNLLTVCACIFEAAAISSTEKFLKATNAPVMQVVGWQGIYCCLITLPLAIAMNFLPIPITPFGDNSHKVFDDLKDFVAQLNNNPMIVLGVLVFVCTTAVHSYTGAFITQFSSSTNLVIAEEIRVLVVWFVAFFLDWERLYTVTLLAFMIIQIGVINYRKATFIEWCRSLILRAARRSYASRPVVANAVASNHPADLI